MVVSVIPHYLVDDQIFHSVKLFFRTIWKADFQLKAFHCCVFRFYYHVYFSCLRYAGMLCF